MPSKVPLLLLSLLSWFGTSHCCLQDPASAYRFTGAVCRLTYPAAVVCESDLDAFFSWYLFDSIY